METSQLLPQRLNARSLPRRYSLISRLLLAGGCLISMTSALASNVTPASKANIDNGIAIHGYDPLSYLEGRAEKGSKAFSTSFEGATYLFVNKKHLETFKVNPARLEPSYKGWCAYAMAASDKVDVDPETFKVIDGRVYLF